MALFALLSLSLMTVDHRQHHLESVRAALSVVVYPLQYAMNLPVSAGEWLSETLATREQLRQENTRLYTQNLLLKERLQKLAALESENRRLRELLDASFRVDERVLIAEIMAVDMEPFSQQIVINKGSRHGVYPGQPLLDAEGVKGQVVHVGPWSSTAMLITDPSHAVPVRINRNNVRAVVVGTGSPTELELQYVPNNADIQSGDLLITSGLGGRFPADYPVATVATVKKNPGQAYATVTAQPMTPMESSREVLLVWSEQRDDDCPRGAVDCKPANDNQTDAPS